MYYINIIKKYRYYINLFYTLFNYKINNLYKQYKIICVNNIDI